MGKDSSEQGCWYRVHVESNDARIASQDVEVTAYSRVNAIQKVRAAIGHDVKAGFRAVELTGPDGKVLPHFHTLQCTECGRSAQLHFTSQVNQRLLQWRLCYDCLHWSDCVLQKENPNSVRCKGVHYFIHREDAPQAARGHGGRRFLITFHDGRVVETTNLWCQGSIPAHFKERLPDNAQVTPK